MVSHVATDRNTFRHVKLESLDSQSVHLQVIVVDEIGSAEEVKAVKSIAQRGVMMVGTAHGISLSSLIGNPELNALVGGVHQVVLGDMQAA